MTVFFTEVVYTVIYEIRSNFVVVTAAKQKYRAWFYFRLNSQRQNTNRLPFSASVTLKGRQTLIKARSGY